MVRAWGPSVPEARRFADFAGLPFRPSPLARRYGARTGRTNRFRESVSFVVELPPGSLSRRAADRYGSRPSDGSPDRVGTSDGLRPVLH